MKRILILLLTLAFIPMVCLADSEKSKGKAKKETLKKAEYISLFNGKDLEGWHIYLKDENADPKEVWKVKDGAIWCKGDPFGFIRTTKKFKDFIAIREPGVNLKIHPKEVVVIIGSSGSGKSTLLRCMNRLIEPSSGQVFSTPRHFSRPPGAI